MGLELQDLFVNGILFLHVTCDDNSIDFFFLLFRFFYYYLMHILLHPIQYKS